MPRSSIGPCWGAAAFSLTLLFSIVAEAEAGGERLWTERPLQAVEIEGLRRTQSVVVSRELRLGVGEVIEWPRIEADRLRLLDLGLFADVTLGVRRDPVADAPILTYRFQERPTFVALPIFEYDPEDRFSYGLYFADRNFRGLDQSLTLSGALGGRKSGRIGFGTPWFLGRRLGFGVGTFYSDRKKRTELIRERRKGVSVALAPAWNYETQLTVFLGVEEATTRPLHPDEPNPPLRERDDHRWGSLRWSWDTRDYRARALSGHVVRLTATQHGGPLGGTTDFRRYGVDLLQVWSTGHGTALTAATRTLMSEGSVPRFLRQNLGGVNNLRGFEQGEFGGESRWYGWVEERVPLLRKQKLSIWRGQKIDFTIDATAFVDVGTIWEGNDLLRGNAQGRWGAGGGLRVVAPWVDVFRLEAATNGTKFRVYAVGGVRL